MTRRELLRAGGLGLAGLVAPRPARSASTVEVRMRSDVRGEHGELPPNDWTSIFGGPAWTRVPDGQWYLHLFAPEQPDFNWSNPKVREEFEDILRFGFNRGVDGIRIDPIVPKPALKDEMDDEIRI